MVKNIIVVISLLLVSCSPQELKYKRKIDYLIENINKNQFMHLYGINARLMDLERLPNNVVAMDAIENNYYEGVGIAPTFFQQTVYHELGHGFGEGSGGNGFDQSIILENNYLRATGRNYYRKYHGNPSDSDHSNIFKHFRKQ